MISRLTRILLSGALAILTPVSALHAQSSWSIQVSLDDPSVQPAALLVAVTDLDPARGFAARHALMADDLARRLERTEGEQARAIVLESSLAVAWNNAFEKIPGDDVHLLLGTGVGTGFLYSSGSAEGPRWLVSKTRRVDGRLSCWSVPFAARAGDRQRINLDSGNRIDLVDHWLEAEASAPPPDEAADSGPLQAKDVARLVELFRITDVLGDALWPGFDARAVPIAVNFDDAHELLLGHPDPPAEYLLVEGRDADGIPLLMREGVSRYGPGGGGWAVELAGADTVYVSRPVEGESLDRYLLVLLHEAFHVYQDRFRGESEGPWQEPPEDDANYSAGIGLESRVLAAALATEDETELRELAAAFVAVRHARREGLSPGVLRYETEYEFSEGTATYSQVRALELLIEAGGLEGAGLADDPDYRGFRDAAPLLEDFLSKVLASPDAVIAFIHAQYQHGMAQCLVLDRVRSGWKEELREAGISQFTLLEREFPLDAAEEERLLELARDRFDWEELHARQLEVIQAQTDLLLGYVAGPGRRYRVHHAAMPGAFKWKPQGPVYHVPVKLLGEEGEGRSATLWVGGIQRFERGALDFESGAVPVLFRSAYMEWIDRNPDPEDADFRLDYARLEDGVYHELVVETDGFTLRVPRARIDRGEEVVDIHPLP